MKNAHLIISLRRVIPLGKKKLAVRRRVRVALRPDRLFGLRQQPAPVGFRGWGDLPATNCSASAWVHSYGRTYRRNGPKCCKIGCRGVNPTWLNMLQWSGPPVSVPYLRQQAVFTGERRNMHTYITYSVSTSTHSGWSTGLGLVFGSDVNPSFSGKSLALHACTFLEHARVWLFRLPCRATASKRNRCSQNALFPCDCTKVHTIALLSHKLAGRTQWAGRRLLETVSFF